MPQDLQDRIAQFAGQMDFSQQGARFEHAAEGAGDSADSTGLDQEASDTGGLDMGDLNMERARGKTGRRNRCGKCGQPKKGHTCTVSEPAQKFRGAPPTERATAPSSRKLAKRPKTNIKTHRLIFVEQAMKEQGGDFDPVCRASGLLMPSAQTGILMCADMHICQEYCERMPCEHC